ncbi:hypothetical protein ACQP1U_15630 [Actinomycetota bacterium]
MQIDFSSAAESGSIGVATNIPLPSASSPLAIVGFPRTYTSDSALPPPRPTVIVAPGARHLSVWPATADGPVSGEGAAKLTPLRVGGKVVPGVWTATLDGQMAASGFTMTATDAAGRETTRTQRDGDDSDPMDLFPAF